jgi:hypothetical protein
MNAIFNSKLERDSLFYEVRLDRQAGADDQAYVNRMKSVCRNAVPDVSSDLHLLGETPIRITFTNTGRKEFFEGTGEEYQLAITCTLIPTKTYYSITIDASERGLPGSLKLKTLKPKVEQMVARVQRGS